MSEQRASAAQRISEVVGSWPGVKSGPHRFGWVTAPLEGPEDADRVIELFRLSYERAAKARRPRQGTTQGASDA
jgi:hypothetical protein